MKLGHYHILVMDLREVITVDSAFLSVNRRIIFQTMGLNYGKFFQMVQKS
jgi:hypothetical protein